jgi:hypothetical protein
MARMSNRTVQHGRVMVTVSSVSTASALCVSGSVIATMTAVTYLMSRLICTYPVCDPKTQFTCDNGRCIALSAKCNQFDDCRDNSDESQRLCGGEESKCPAGQFKCGGGQGISAQSVCNKRPDCPDGSDESLHCGVNECDDVSVHQCEHNCVDTPISYYCTCNPGFKLNLGKKACIDIDECRDLPAACSQLCVNSYGSYVCNVLTVTLRLQTTELAGTPSHGWCSAIATTCVVCQPMVNHTLFSHKDCTMLSLLTLT